MAELKKPTRIIKHLTQRVQPVGLMSDEGRDVIGPRTRRSRRFAGGGVPNIFVQEGGWIEVDPDSNLVVPAAELGEFLYTGPKRPLDNAHGLHPLQGDVWNGDFTFRFRIRENNNVGSSAFTYICAVLSGEVDHMGGAAGVYPGGGVGGISFSLTTPSTGDFYHFWVAEWDSSSGANPIMTLSLNPGTRGTYKYAKFYRRGNVLYIEVYSNSDYTGLLGSNNVTLVKANNEILTVFYAINLGITTGSPGVDHDLSVRFDEISRN